MWASRIVSLPKRMPKLINKSIKEIPVTISAFSMGILLTAKNRFLAFAFILERAMQVKVPIMVAAREDTSAMNRVLERASIMDWLSKRARYHFAEKPPHFALVRLSLKDRIIRVTMGA